jgi:hypothetical protein
VKPINTGIALSVTVIVFYSLCTFTVVLWPAQFMEFMNALFHGLDFGRLSASIPFSWASFGGALIIMGAWTFAAGTFFAWFHNMLSVNRLHSAVRPS